MTPDETTKAALITFLSVSKEAWKKEAESYVGGRRTIMEMARYIARATDYQPPADWENEMVMGIPGGEICRDVVSTAAICFPVQPRWMCFWREAELAYELCDRVIPHGPRDHS